MTCRGDEGEQGDDEKVVVSLMSCPLSDCEGGPAGASPVLSQLATVGSCVIK